MRRLLLLLLAVGACASTPAILYVPGGSALPNDARTEYRRALALERKGDDARALGKLDKLCVEYPASLGIHLHRLRLALDFGGVKRAVSLYDPLPAGMDPERAAVLVALAKTPEDAVAKRTTILEAATAQEPSNAFWWLALADVRLTAHDIVMERAVRGQALGSVQAAAKDFEEADRLIEEARQDAETALTYDADLKEAHLLLGFIYTRVADSAKRREVGDFQRGSAEPHYKRAVELDPECVVARLNRAENFLHFGEYKNAIVELKAAQKLAPKEPMVWNNLGYTYYGIGYLQDAVSCYREALSLDPKNARIRTALADGLRRMDKTKDALRELEVARKDAAGDEGLLADIAFKLAAIYEYQKRYREAVVEYQRYVDLGGDEASKAESRIRAIYAGAYDK